MTSFVFLRTDTEDLQTPTIPAGSDGSEGSAMLFSDADAANEFRELSGSYCEETVAALEPVPMLKWLIEQYQNGIKYVTVNPKSADFNSPTSSTDD